MPSFEPERKSDTEEADSPRPFEPPTLGPDASPFVGGDLEMRISPSLERAASRLSTWTTPVWPMLAPPSSATNGEAVGPDGSASFGNYELLREIGRGGMGVVYKARQKGLDRVVAIKMILSSHLANLDQVDRFYAEARAAAKLQDPHVVAIHDVGAIHGQHYFAMEFIEGPSLAQRLHSGPIEPEAAAKLVATVARAVDRLHARGIVHRDLKPSNILLDRSGRPFVTDFGLAKMFSADRPETENSAAIVGTPSYMAPEQASGRKSEVGPLSDVYSLGAILYEMIAGRPPFEERNPLDTLVQVLESEPVPPGRLREGVPKALEAICLKCLEKSPGERYSSASELANDLDRYLTGEVVEARKLGVWTHLRRWSRREPSLVSRLSVMAISVSILQLDAFLRESYDQRLVSRRVLAVVALGTIASLSFQGLLKRERWSTLARYAWATADVILFATVVMILDGLGTSMVAGFFLLVAASGLWFRERLVGYTTALAVVAYGVLVGIQAAIEHRLTTPHLHILFMSLLAVSGLIIGYQVKRVRALSLYYEHRPLP
jgi:serine/threonine-protein kinase